MITTDHVLSLYRQYAEDLRDVRRQQYWLQFWHNNTLARRLHKKVYRPLGFKVRQFDPLLHDLEGEITYLLVRDKKPRLVIEISPNTGWSTTWILSALSDNRNEGFLKSYDLHDTCLAFVPRSLAVRRWEFVKGDCRRTLTHIEDVDYLFIDSDHSREFGEWYVEAVLPRLRPVEIVSVHDIVHWKNRSGESEVVLRWLEQNGCPYWTAAPAAASEITKTVMDERRQFPYGSP